MPNKLYIFCLFLLPAYVINNSFANSNLNNQNIQKKPLEEYLCTTEFKRLLIKLAKKPLYNQSILNYELSGWLDLIQIIESPLCLNKTVENKKLKPVNSKNANSIFTQKLKQKLQFWAQQYTSHPAKELFPKIFALNIAAIKKIAVLLPFNKKYQNYSQKIITKIEQLAAQGPIEVQVYDTQSTHVLDLYQQAVNDKADCIVGPLQKEQIDKLAKYQHNIPVLAFNPGSAIGSSAKFFSLSRIITGEAAALLKQLDKQQYSRGLLLYPEKNKKLRLLAMQLKQLFIQNYGEWIDVIAIDKKNNRYANIIQSALHIKQSIKRQKTLIQTINQALEFNPRRRQDIDFIVLLGSVSQLQQLYPQLRYWYAEDIPVYSSSLTSSFIDISNDVDLSGIQFTHAFWAHSSDSSTLQNKLNLIAEQAFNIVIQTNCMRLDVIFLNNIDKSKWQFIPEKGQFLFQNNSP
ncbi:MAG: penicillin-binding protein activator [Pseudomonadota bacterium]